MLDDARTLSRIIPSVPGSELFAEYLDKLIRKLIYFDEASVSGGAHAAGLSAGASKEAFARAEEAVKTILGYASQMRLTDFAEFRDRSLFYNTAVVPCRYVWEGGANFPSAVPIFSEEGGFDVSKINSIGIRHECLCHLLSINFGGIDKAPFNCKEDLYFRKQCGPSNRSRPCCDGECTEPVEE